MAQLTVLQIINACQAELGLPQSTTVVGNADPTTVQMLALLNQAIEELRDFNDQGWTVLQWEYNLAVNPPVETTGDVVEDSAIITNIPSTAALNAEYFTVAGDNIPQAARIASVDSATQITMTMLATGTQVGAELQFAQDTYALPSDFRKYTNRTWWDRTNRWELLGPDSPQLDQWHRSGIVATGPRRHFRNIGPFANRYRLWPPPFEITQPLQLVFEYTSLNTISVNGSATSFAQVIANDADVPLLDSRALILSVKWRFWEQKGLNWTSKRNDYDIWVDRLMGRDGGAPTLCLVTRVDPIFISPANVQDGFFPGPTGPNTG